MMKLCELTNVDSKKEFQIELRSERKTLMQERLRCPSGRHA
jgi:hypothetical protein